MWECVEGALWGVAIQTPFPKYDAEAYGNSLHEALENLMRELNKGADLPAASPKS
jgi:hypothetical protein